MKQAANIRKATDPDEVLFVIDAMIGQDAVATAKAFQEGVDFTGVVLTKLDGDARGGAALSVASVTGRPIVFASTGEKLEDFEPFHPDRMASRILDLGDILTLIEQAQAGVRRAGGDRARGEDRDLDLHARGLPQADAAAAQPRRPDEDDRDAARRAADARAARPVRRARDRAHGGDHPVDDARRAAEPEAPERLPPPPHRARLRHDRHRREPAGPAVRPGREDDEDRRARRRPADPGHGARSATAATASRCSRRRRARSRATRRSARRRTRRSPRAAR